MCTKVKVIELDLDSSGKLTESCKANRGIYPSVAVLIPHLNLTLTT